MHVSNERTPTPLGDIILKRMADLGYRRQADLARAANLGPDVISRAITKPAKPEIPTLRALAATLALDPDTLIAFVHGSGDGLTGTPVRATTPTLDPDIAETNRLLRPDSPLTDDQRDELRAFLRRLNATYLPARRRGRTA